MVCTITNNDDNYITLDVDISETNIGEIDDYITLLFPYKWDSHRKRCDICNSFFKRISNQDDITWYVLIEGEWYIMEFLNDHTDEIAVTINGGPLEVRNIKIITVTNNEFLNRGYDIYHHFNV